MQEKLDSGDGVVTLDELYAYVREEVPRTGLSEIGEGQNPTLLPDDRALEQLEGFLLTKVRKTFSLPDPGLKAFFGLYGGIVCLCDRDGLRISTNASQ